MKFLQVHTFYEQYLNEFYQRRPALLRASHEEHIQALLEDVFAVSHMLPPWLKPLGYDAHLVIANNVIAQYQWASHHGVSIKNAEDWRDEILLAQVEALQPDILYFGDPIVFHSRFVRKLKWKPRFIFGWRAAPIPVGTDWSEFDLMLSHLTVCRQHALQIGAKAAEFFFPGFPPAVAEAVRDTAPTYDVVFSGQWSSMHGARNLMLKELTEQARGSSAFKLGLYLPDYGNLPPEVKAFNHGARWGMDMFRALRTGRINVNAESDMNRGEAGNMRLFETTGVGAFLLTEDQPNIRRYFEPGVEIETFRNHAELLEKIKFYLANPEKREAIARRGQERCLREYSMEKRVAVFDGIMREAMERKARSQPPIGKAAEDGQALAAKAVERLNANDNEAAASLFEQAIALRPDLPQLRFGQGVALGRLGRIAAAVEALQKLLVAQPQHAKAAALLNELRQKLAPAASSAPASTPAPSPALTSAPAPAPAASVGQADAEFQKLVAMIRPATSLNDALLFSLFSMAKRLCADNVPGNFVEFGHAGGGAAALLAYVLKRYSKQPRRVLVCVPEEVDPEILKTLKKLGISPSEQKRLTGAAPGLEGVASVASEPGVREACARLGVADVVSAWKGEFREILPKLRDHLGMIAILHVGAASAEAAGVALEQLYDRIVDGGLLQVDDAASGETPARVIAAFEARRRLKALAQPVDGAGGTGSWFVKPDRFPVNPVIDPSLIQEYGEVDPAKYQVTSQMSVNERFQLFYLLREELPHPGKARRFVEIGSYAGASLLMIHQTLKRAGDRLQGYAVEPGGQPLFYEVLRHLQGEVTHLKLFSTQAAHNLRRIFEADMNYPDFILVDGDHTYEGVRQDVLNYYPLLAPGGIMAFHDYLPPLSEGNREAIYYHHANAEPGIRQACEELMEEAYQCEVIEAPLLRPTDPTQTQAQLPIIPGVYSTLRAYRKRA